MNAVTLHADEINREHQLARRHANDAIKHAIRCGELLAQKKAELPHGTFTAWIMKNCKFKQATANNYMRAAQNPNALGNSIRHLFPSGRPGASASRSPTKATEPDLARQGLKQAAAAADVSLGYVRRVQAIQHREPALLDKISDGSITVKGAEKIIDNEVIATEPLPATESDRSRQAHLERIKEAITAYAKLYGWGAAQMDLVEWLEGAA